VLLARELCYLKYEPLSIEGQAAKHKLVLALVSDRQKFKALQICLCEQKLFTNKGALALLSCTEQLLPCSGYGDFKIPGEEEFKAEIHNRMLEENGLMVMGLMNQMRTGLS